MQFPFLGWEDPLENEMAPTPAFLPGESHGQRSLVGYSPWGHKESDTTQHLSGRPNGTETPPRLRKKGNLLIRSSGGSQNQRKWYRPQNRSRNLWTWNQQTRATRMCSFFQMTAIFSDYFSQCQGISKRLDATRLPLNVHTEKLFGLHFRFSQSQFGVLINFCPAWAMCLFLGPITGASGCCTIFGIGKHSTTSSRKEPTRFGRVLTLSVAFITF